MKKFIATLVLVAMGCEEPLDIQEYIAETCDGTGDHEMVLHTRCPAWAKEEIVDSLEYIDRTLDINVQICGLIEGEPDEVQHHGDVIMCRLERGTGRVGLRRGGDVHIWLPRLRKFQHRRHFRKVFRHEMGHYLERRGTHSTDHHDVMCQGWHGATRYSKADIDLIIEGHAEWTQKGK